MANRKAAAPSNTLSFLVLGVVMLPLFAVIETAFDSFAARVISYIVVILLVCWLSAACHGVMKRVFLKHYFSKELKRH